MHEYTRIIINFFHAFQRTLFNKGFVVEDGEGLLKERMNRGRGSSLSLCSLCEKNCLIFQTANRVPSNKCLVVAKRFIKKT